LAISQSASQHILPITIFQRSSQHPSLEAIAPVNALPDKRSSSSFKSFDSGFKFVAQLHDAQFCQMLESESMRNGFIAFAPFVLRLACKERIFT
jgi:hypothetical protein